MTDERKRGGTMGDEVREGIRAGLGILGAMKDAIEETIEEFLGPERSKDRETEGAADGGDEASPTDDDGPMAEAAQRARKAARDAARSAAESLDVATRKELEALRVELAGLESRVEALERVHRSESETGA